MLAVDRRRKAPIGQALELGEAQGEAEEEVGLAGIGGTA